MPVKCASFTYPDDGEELIHARGLRDAQFARERFDIRFFLGTHRPTWLSKCEHDLFLSRRLLSERKSFPQRIKGEWCLDSGGFTELSLHGKWTITAQEYAEELKRYSEIGGLHWAAQMDMMCEPVMLERTGLSILDHQKATVENFRELRSMNTGGVHVIPVLQGWSLDDYERCFSLFEQNGFDLRDEPTVGLGSVCRRQSSNEIGEVVKHFFKKGLKLHGFGVKKAGLMKYGSMLKSADSMAWSYAARKRSGRCKDTSHHHNSKNCANCLTYALEWRERLMADYWPYCPE